MIFIVGAGRTGSTFIGRLIGRAQNVYPMIEIKPLFQYVCIACIGRKLVEWYPRIKKFYNDKLDSKSKYEYKYILDKSHPAIWFADLLAEDFPESKFIVPIRNPLSVLASTLNMPYMLSEFNIERDKIDRRMGCIIPSIYNSRLLEERILVRWMHTMRKAIFLKEQLGERVYFLNFDDLCHNSDTEILKLESYLNIQITDRPPIYSDVTSKWADTLTELQSDFAQVTTFDLYRRLLEKTS